MLCKSKRWSRCLPINKNSIKIILTQSVSYGVLARSALLGLVKEGILQAMVTVILSLCVHNMCSAFIVILLFLFLRIRNIENDGHQLLKRVIFSHRLCLYK